MEKKKRIYIVCGTGIATSTIVANKVEALLKKRGISAELRRAMTSEARTVAKDADLIIATTQVPDVSVPVLNGIPFITNVGVSKLEEEIVAILTKSST